jgi:hypothetical protein
MTTSQLRQRKIKRRRPGASHVPEPCLDSNESNSSFSDTPTTIMMTSSTYPFNRSFDWFSALIGGFMGSREEIFLCFLQRLLKASVGPGRGTQFGSVYSVDLSRRGFILLTHMDPRKGPMDDFCLIQARHRYFMYIVRRLSILF